MLLPSNSILHQTKNCRIKCLKRSNGTPLSQRGSLSQNLPCSAFGARNRNLLNSTIINLMTLQRRYWGHANPWIMSTPSQVHSILNNQSEKTRFKQRIHTMKKCRQSRASLKIVVKQEIMYWELRKLSDRPCFFKPQSAMSKYPHSLRRLKQLVWVQATTIWNAIPLS